jgi:uncharacterized protein (UPF0333 family)
VFHSRKSQISIEYLSILGFVLVVLIFILALSFVYSRQIEDQIIVNQVDKIAKEIVDSAESVYYYGEPTKTTIKAYHPENIEQISISANDILFVVRTKNGLTDISYHSEVNLTGTISTAPGIKNFQIEAREGYVWIGT